MRPMSNILTACASNSGRLGLSMRTESILNGPIVQPKNLWANHSTWLRCVCNWTQFYSLQREIQLHKLKRAKNPNRIQTNYSSPLVISYVDSRTMFSDVELTTYLWKRYPGTKKWNGRPHGDLEKLLHIFIVSDECVDTPVYDGIPNKAGHRHYTWTR